MFMYGLTTIILVMEHFERLENYEECQKIINAIREQEERLDIKLWTKITPESMGNVVDTYCNFGLTGENVIENSEYYAEIIIKELNDIL